MSRNLGRANCYYCLSEIVYDEKPHPITKEYAGYYFDEYEGSIVANAHCSVCEAQYLAYFDLSAFYARHGMHDKEFSQTQHYDLSFRSTFNDEPGPDDLPRFDVERVVVKKPIETCEQCGVAHVKKVVCYYANRSR